MAEGLTGNAHRDTMNIRHNEHRRRALEGIQNLRSRIEEMDKEDIASGLDKIFKDLDDELSP